MKKSSTILEAICGLFILLFVYTAISKLQTYDSFKIVLRKSPLISDLAGVIAWLLPAAELVAAILLFIPRTRKYGLYACLLLMTVFTAYLGYMIAFTPHLPCSCGGVIKGMTWSQHLLFNTFFLGLALVGIWLNNRKPKVYEKPPATFEPA